MADQTRALNQTIIFILRAGIGWCTVIFSLLMFVAFSGTSLNSTSSLPMFLLIIGIIILPNKKAFLTRMVGDIKQIAESKPISQSESTDTLKIQYQEKKQGSKRLIQCQDCNNDVSKNANKCPHCGARVVNKQAHFAAIVVIIIASCTIYQNLTKNMDAEKQRVANLTPAQQKEEQIKKQFSPFDGHHYNLERYIKASMNNPDSYEHVKTSYLVQDKLLIVTTVFRGQNAFGAIIKQSITARVGASSGEVFNLVK